MKTIFFAHSVDVIGGAERVTLSIIDGLNGTNNCVMLVPSLDGDLAKEARNSGAQVFNLNFSQPDFSRPVQGIKQLFTNYNMFKKLSPLVVHCGDLLALRSLQPICKLLNIPIICHVHYPYEKSFMQWVFKNRYAPKIFIFCSLELQQNLEPALSTLCPSSKLTVIHNGIDTELFKPQSAPSNTTPKIGIVANLQERKGHDDFLHMAKILTDKGIDLHYEIIGGDILQAPREPYLKTLAQNLGIAERVSFHGQISNVREALTTLDIVVCASHEEAFPISILEAMACGKAIVSTNVNGIPEAISDKATGLLTPPHNPEALSNAVLTLLNDPNYKSCIEKNSREHVVDNFSHPIFIKKIEKLIVSINNR